MGMTAGVLHSMLLSGDSAEWLLLWILYSCRNWGRLLVVSAAISTRALNRIHLCWAIVGFGVFLRMQAKSASFTLIGADNLIRRRESCDGRSPSFQPCVYLVQQLPPEFPNAAQSQMREAKLSTVSITRAQLPSNAIPLKQNRDRDQYCDHIAGLGTDSSKHSICKKKKRIEASNVQEISL